MEVGKLIGNDGNLSDDEIFFGKMTLKEAKKLIFMNYPQRQTISYSTSTEEQDKDDSIRIIETRSEPDIVEVDNSIDLDLKAVSSPNVICDYPKGSDLEVKPDDSFIRLEKMVSELCMSPTDKQVQLDNTLEVVDFILNNAEQKHEDNKVLPHLDMIDVEVDSNIRKNPNHVNITNIENMPHINEVENYYNVQCETDACAIPNSKIDNCNIANNVENTPNVDDAPNKDICITPKTKMENSCATEIFNSAKLENSSKINPDIQKLKCNTNLLSVTPNKNINSNAIFKTPKNSVFSKKPLTSTKKKTPNIVNAYQHITSPIASYIKNCPQVPLVKDVHPQRPLPTKSAIPQPIKSISKATNKENIQFPSVAYKSAKKIQMVSIPNSEKLPRGEWTNKLTSSLKKPVVITHGQRVMSNVKNLNKRQEDSFANLTLQQADLSVCTKKSAF